MIKIYFSYFFIGLVTLSNILVLWGITNRPPSILSYIDLISSLIIFCIATGLVLFLKKAAAWIALLAQLGLIPAFVYLFTLSIQEDFNFASIIYLVLYLFIIVLYLLTCLWNIQIIRDKYVIAIHIKKPIRIILSFLPTVLLMAWYLAYKLS